MQGGLADPGLAAARAAHTLQASGLQAAARSGNQARLKVLSAGAIESKGAISLPLRIACTSGKDSSTHLGKRTSREDVETMSATEVLSVDDPVSMSLPHSNGSMSARMRNQHAGSSTRIQGIHEPNTAPWVFW